jgi:hypothetical protein
MEGTMSTATATKKAIKAMKAKPTTYRIEEIGTVTVDTGTITILDPCRIKHFSEQHEDSDPFSPLYPGIGRIEDGKLIPPPMDGLAVQLLDPECPAKVDKPTRLEDYGTTEGNALSLSTGFGDGEYTVVAEIVDYGEHVGERVAAIHIQFVHDEDIDPYREQYQLKEAKKAAKTGN